MQWLTAWMIWPDTWEWNKKIVITCVWRIEKILKYFPCLLSSLVICIANIAFTTTHLSNCVTMGGEKKKENPIHFLEQEDSG